METMSSLLCEKRLAGNVKIHDLETAKSLCMINEDDKIDMLFMSRAQGEKRTQRPQSTPNIPFCDYHSRKMDSGHYLNRSLRMQDWISKNQIKELQEKSVLENSDVHRMYTSLLKTEETFVKDVSDYISHCGVLKLRRKELLHKRWNDRVYEPLRAKILQALHGQNWLEQDHRRRELHRQYLEHINKKGHVFLDTMDKEEYYAQALNSHRPAPVTVYTPVLCDPLLAQIQEHITEDQTILRCVTGQTYTLEDIDQIKLPPLPLIPLGRHGTDCLSWLEMALSNIESTPRKASRLRMKGNSTQSQIHFDQWTQLPFDCHVVDKELRTQKKRLFEEKPPYGIPARQFAQAPFESTTTYSEHKQLSLVAT